MRNNLDAGENLNKKEKIHDLDDEQSSIPPDFCYTCSMVKTMCRYVQIQLHTQNMLGA
jgi:hypothetical protein